MPLVKRAAGGSAYRPANILPALRVSFTCAILDNRLSTEVKTSAVVVPNLEVPALDTMTTQLHCHRCQHALTLLICVQPNDVAEAICQLRYGVISKGKVNWPIVFRHCDGDGTGTCTTVASRWSALSRNFNWIDKKLRYRRETVRQLPT